MESWSRAFDLLLNCPTFTYSSRTSHRSVYLLDWRGVQGNGHFLSPSTMSTLAFSPSSCDDVQAQPLRSSSQEDARGSLKVVTKAQFSDHSLCH